MVELLTYPAAVLYIAASLCFFVCSGRENFFRFAYMLALAGLLVNSWALVLRITAAGRLPVSNGSEFLLCFAWLTVLIYLLFPARNRNGNAGGIVLLTAGFLLISIPLLMPGMLDYIQPLTPALKSPWLTVHVLTAVLAYSAFALAAGLAAVRLIKKSSPEGGLQVSQIIAAGFVMLTLTIVLGAIWAEQAWGRYWGWDPKETWSLVTWIVYALYLHYHRQPAWQGKRSDIMVIAGFLLVLFTFFGVNYFLAGLHVYG